MHTTTEIHAATKVAQQMAKKKEKKRWAQKAGYKHSSKGAKGNNTLHYKYDNHYKYYVLGMLFWSWIFQTCEILIARYISISTIC